MKYLRKAEGNKPLAVWLVILLDILLVGVILLVFAFFHHVLPRMQVQQQLQQLQQQQQQTPNHTKPTESTIVQTEATELSTDPTVVTTEPDNRTEWQKKFADKFTDEVIITDTSYTSPEVSITIDKVVTGEGMQRVAYYVADVYVASIDNFKTYTPHNHMVFFDTQKAEEMAAESNAILAMSGDFLTYQKNGFLVRNGETYVADRNASICALFPDGTMETYDKGSYKVEDILAREPVHVWSFGPVLLDEQGQVRDKFDISLAVSYRNPRCGIGYVEPGHYVFITVDGRQDGHSRGMFVDEMAEVFVERGCKVAYNLDGGGTAVMLFDGDRISRQSNGQRALGDILLITETGYSVHAKEGQE